jgi:hypothetical protein
MWQDCVDARLRGGERSHAPAPTRPGASTARPSRMTARDFSAQFRKAIDARIGELRDWRGGMRRERRNPCGTVVSPPSVCAGRRPGCRRCRRIADARDRRARTAHDEIVLSRGVSFCGSVQLPRCGTCFARPAAVQPNRRNRGPLSNERLLVARRQRAVDASGLPRSPHLPLADEGAAGLPVPHMKVRRSVVRRASHATTTPKNSAMSGCSREPMSIARHRSRASAGARNNNLNL